MEITKTLRAGVHGTKALVDKYGDKLCCVRYRRDKDGERMLTVELIEATGVSEPTPAVDEVWVQVSYDEFDLRRQIKEAGGQWEPERRAWLLPKHQVQLLGLLDRILLD